MEALTQILNTRLIAISRGFYGHKLLQASTALYKAGIRAFEVTYEQDKPKGLTASAIEMLRAGLPSDAAVGAGTVMTPEQAGDAFRAGAEFIISPNVSEEVIRETKRLGMISIPGAMTPSEIASSYAYGADIIKVFPAGVLGKEYFKAIRAPFAHIPMAAVAGITPENIRDFSDAGAVAFGVSSGLYVKSAVESGDLEQIEAAARRFISALH